MFKMSDTCYDHGHAVAVAEFHRLPVADRTPWLDHRSDAGLVCNLHAIGKWKEGIRCHHRILEREAEVLRLGNGLPERIDARRLARTAGQQLPVLSQHNGIG